ncbi:MAG: polysaccharide biosynthesis/export family protein [Waddliaceae bacterium]
MMINVGLCKKAVFRISFEVFLVSCCCCSWVAAQGDMCTMMPGKETSQDMCITTDWEEPSGEIFDIEDHFDTVQVGSYALPTNFQPRKSGYSDKTPSGIPFLTNELAQDYRLKIGDTMLISVYGEKDTEREVVVDPRGMLSYLFVDSIPASGKTLAEIRELLQEQLRKYYRFVTLSITPIKFNAEFFTIVGEVNRPGKKPIVGRPTLLSAICQAGGFTTLDFRDQLMDLCQLDKAFLVRNGDYVPIDFVRLVRHGDLSQDVPLEAGDYIFIPNLKMKQVFVLGEVLSTVAIDYLNTMSLVEAIAEAGDVTEYASSRVVVLRGSLACPARYLVDYPRIVKGCAPDFPLQPGDIVYVPQRRLTRLREIVREAVRIFVDTAAYVSGSEAFIRTHPHARGDFNFGSRVSGGGSVVAP